MAEWVCFVILRLGIHDRHVIAVPIHAAWTTDAIYRLTECFIWCGTPGHVVSNQGIHLTIVKSDLGYY